MLTRKKELDNSAENAARQYLEKSGLTRKTENFGCKHGEIDLIMQDGDTLVFIEVRLRSHQSFGGAAATVSRAKQHKIIRTAQFYLQRLAGAEPPCRFDVVAVDGQGKMNWIKAAFEANV